MKRCCKCNDNVLLNCVCGIYDELNCHIQGCCWCCTYTTIQTMLNDDKIQTLIKEFNKQIKKSKKIDKMVYKTIQIFINDLYEEDDELTQMLEENYQLNIDDKTIEVTTELEEIEQSNTLKIRKQLSIYDLYMEILKLFVIYEKDAEFNIEKFYEFTYYTIDGVYQAMSELAILFAQAKKTDDNQSLINVTTEAFSDVEAKIKDIENIIKSEM